MAAAPLGQPPVRLSLERLGYYRDDNLRLWKVLSLRFTPDHPTHSNPGARVTVRLSQVDECCQEIRSPMFSCLACLPMSWMHLSLGLYSGSDVRLWKLVEHDWVSVCCLPVKAAAVWRHRATGTRDGEPNCSRLGFSSLAHAPSVKILCIYFSAIPHVSSFQSLLHGPALNFT
ncbi:protein TCL1B4-like isoform X1 [Mesocricetus auratus]|uniref:Protein TCL1B4-like isoform X1 n=1 Tax=Mesocricetus auratus TaxID=10036 RepID=A0ABM2X8X5_MESAU|nr:protein TCL1B4-like isoform X1 [Mesocricetus auratus]